jgi:trans-aconitate methyltransferase
MNISDFYSPIAEFYELMVRQQRAGASALAEALTGVPTSNGPVLDLGAGTGRSTEVIAATLPDARIWAVEPSPAMRAVLTSNVIRNDDLRRRVTILAEPAQRLKLPPQLSAAVVFGVAGHLDRTERRALWDDLLPRLPKGAPILVELMPLAKPQRVPSMRVTSEIVGEHTYELWLEGEPEGEDAMRWSSTWRISQGDSPVRTVNNTSKWFTFGIDDLMAELQLPSKKLAPNLGVAYR